VQLSDRSVSRTPRTLPLDIVPRKEKTRRVTLFSQDLELGEADSEERTPFPPADRKLTTQPYDLSVQTLAEQWSSGILVLPDIQREYVWDDAKASRLIESLLLNVPVPVLYFAETAEAKYEIIDGHQRVRSIVRFLSNEFALTGIRVLTEYGGCRVTQLPDREQRFLRMRTLRAIIIGYESAPNMKFEIFERLNSGAIALNAQELRHAMYRGTLNRLLHELVRYGPFREIVGGKHPRKHMVDEELTLRFFTFYDRMDRYKPPLKRFLNDYMSENRNVDPATQQTLSELFRQTIDRVHSFVGGAAFRLADVNGRPMESAVNRALFDAQMLPFAWASDVSSASRETVLRELAQLYQQSTFLDAIQRATGDRARTRTRIRETVAALQRSGMMIAVPYDLAD
jgi:hypothetical protein